MKLVVSSIAWTNEEEVDVAKVLQELGVKYVEIAPTKLWDEPIETSDEKIEEYKKWWANYGIEIVAFQSMLFAHPDYKIFESEAKREVTKKYLQDFTYLAGKMGAQRMVFGSPKNRQKGDLSDEAAQTIAIDFFKDIAETAQTNNTIFCVEPNALQYNCDFITTAKQGIELVKAVNHPGFGLHLDIACMTLAGDDIADSIKESAPYLKHFHISAPMLEQVEDREDVDYRQSATTLKEIGYNGYISIEMRPGDAGTNIERVTKAVTFVTEVYSSL